MRVGRPARIVVENVGLLEHDLKVVGVPSRDVRVSGTAHGHAGDVAAHAMPGTQEWVEFTPIEKGTYDFECTIADHKDVGMRGKLIVE